MKKYNKLEDNFLIPPFSVFDTKQQYWIDRRKKWLKLGIKGELGRDAGCLPKGFDEKKYGIKQSQETSVFDPALCEICYAWFNIEDGCILDCFAGGSVRDIVASLSGYKYIGIDLSEKQIKANEQQWIDIKPQDDYIKPTWLTGDSNQVLDLIENESVDLIFSCPPYFDLEVYSDNKQDLSNMTYNQFLEVYSSIIKKSLDKLKNNRFAVFVVGDVRDEKGFYRNLPEETVNIFTKWGALKYNEIILVNSIGTLPIRAGKIFNNSRKIGKMHQNVLVFFKGDAKKINEIFGKLDLDDGEQSTLQNYF